jgi:hypothetical protein
VLYLISASTEAATARKVNISSLLAIRELRSLAFSSSNACNLRCNVRGMISGQVTHIGETARRVRQCKLYLVHISLCSNTGPTELTMILNLTMFARIKQAQKPTWHSGTEVGPMECRPVKESLKERSSRFKLLRAAPATVKVP